jgi:bifunctional non-homologous end joining protein LigD
VARRVPQQPAEPAADPAFPVQTGPAPARGVEAPPDTPAAGVPAAVEARRLEQHFVYNALNTIASLMRTDAARARELLLGFADLTRAADRPEGVPGTLGDELAAVRAYLELEQARFGRRLQVEIVIDEGLHALPMAPRRVLDAVRAVVQQRIEPRPDGGTVTVTAERAGAGCVVRVAERDGAGRGGEPTLVAPG